MAGLKWFSMHTSVQSIVYFTTNKPDTQNWHTIQVNLTNKIENLTVKKKVLR